MREEDRNKRLDRCIAKLQRLQNRIGTPIDVELKTRYDASDPTRAFDAEVELAIGQARAHLHIEVRGVIHARDACEAVHRHAAHGAETPGTTTLLAAHRVAAKARRILQMGGVGYQDAHGTLFLPARTIHIDIEQAKSEGVSTVERKLFEGKKERVMHVLMESRGEWLEARRIARKAGTSPKTIWETLSRIERMGWLTARRTNRQKKRRLTDPEGVVDAWTEHRRSEPQLETRRYRVPGVDDTQTLGERLDTACAQVGAEYAITGEIAAQKHLDLHDAPPQETLWCRLGRIGASQVLEAMQACEDDAGALVVVRPNGAQALRQRMRHDGRWWIATWLQTYLDLIGGAQCTPHSARTLRTASLSSPPETRTQTPTRLADEDEDP